MCIFGVSLLNSHRPDSLCPLHDCLHFIKIVSSPLILQKHLHRGMTECSALAYRDGKKTGKPGSEPSTHAQRNPNALDLHAWLCNAELHFVVVHVGHGLPIHVVTSIWWAWLIILCAYAQQGYVFGHVSLYYIYIYFMYVNKKQAVYYLTARKSPTKCILLLSY